MAASGYTPISLYYSTTAAAVPTSGNLVAGELALNTVDEKLYFKNSSGTVKLLASNAVTTPVTTIGFGTTGLTPSTATSGAVTVAGTLVVGNGGTGLAVGTSGGVPYFSSTSAMTSSAVLTSNALVLGGGAGAAPAPLASLGTTTTVLHGNAAGAPTFGAVSLTADVSGTLPAANGGTGVANNAAMTVTGSGNFAYTRTLTGTTNVTLPTTGTLATLAGTETFTNKTLTTPIISSISNTGTLTLPTSTDTLVGRATTDTLTNKTLTSPTLTAPVLGTPFSGTLSSCTVDGTNKVGYLNIPLSGTKTASYTLVVGDVGKFVILGTSGLVVVPASIFAVGDAISVANNTAAAITCTSSAVTAYLGGTNTVVTSFSLASRGVCTILYVTASVVFITGNVS